VQQQSRAHEVSQELQPEPRPLGRALDQPRYVGQHEAAVDVHPYHAERRHERGERIVGNLGARGGNSADQGGFSGVRHAKQPNVGKELQLELQAPVLAFGAARELARRAVHARLEV
jgi:hypothetical protein